MAQIKAKYALRFNMYVEERERPAQEDREEKIKGYILDKDGRSDFEGVVNAAARRFVFTVKNHHGNLNYAEV